jgi:hypothetical protein
MAARTWRRHGVLFLSALVVLSTVGCKKDKAESGVVDSEAETTAPASVSAWAGTLSWEHEATGRLNEETYRASVEYRNVAPTSSGDAGYRADVTVDYIRTWLFNCQSGGQTRIEEKQNYSGPYPLPGPYTGDDPNLKAQREGAALMLDSRPEGVWFDTQPMFLELRMTTSCPNEPAGESTATAVSNDLLDAPSRLTGDSDPDPDHLVGTTEWTLANPPEKTLGDWESWSFRVTYDLRRQVVDTDRDGDGIPDHRDPDGGNGGGSDGGDGGGSDHGGGGEDDDRKKACKEEPQKNPVFCYAPLVHIADGDDHLPVSAASFVAASTLKWSKNDCQDKDDFADGTPDPRKLGSGGYVYDPAGERCQGSAQGRFTSREITRPYMPLCTGEPAEGGCKSSALGEPVEGFFLDPDPAILGGASAAAVEAGAVPVYYQFAPGNYVAYWFFWPYSVPGQGALGVVGAEHQGDWEHIVVRLDDANKATAVEYFFHHWWKSVGWAAVERIEDTHPIVYAAEEGHGSYWSTDCDFRVVPGLDPRGRTFDRCSASGPRWETWENLHSTNAEPWYGFGGAWGKVGGYELGAPPGEAFSNKDTTGPPGPHPDLDPTSAAHPDAEYTGR